MSKSTSKRANAVIDTFTKIDEILEKRDQYEVREALLQEIDPETLALLQKGTVPRWRAEMIFVLTELYDKGYVDSTKDSEQLK